MSLRARHSHKEHSTGRPARLRVQSGPRVNDIFVGEYAPIVAHVIVIPRQPRRYTVRVTTEPSATSTPLLLWVPPVQPSVPKKEQPAELLVAHAPSAEEQIDPASLQEDLQTLLTEDTERHRLLAERAALFRAAARSEVRGKIASGQHREQSLHLRVKASRVRRRPIPIHTPVSRAAPLKPTKEKPVPRIAKAPVNLGAVGNKRERILPKLSFALPLPVREQLPSHVKNAKQGVLDSTANLPALRPERRRRVIQKSKSDAEALETERLRKKASVREPLRVAVWAFLLGTFVLQLAALGQVPRVVRDVEKTARGAAEKLLSGVTALVAATDAQASIEQFSSARAAFEEASRQLSEGTTFFQRLASRLDPAQRLPAAEHLLNVGLLLSDVGERMAALVTVIRTSEVPLTETLERVAPALASVTERVQEARAEIERVSSSGFPPADASDIERVRGAVVTLDELLQRWQKSQHVMLELLGARQDRQYLVLFENHRELRPSGGFIGSFALVSVSKGAVKNIRVDTIYNPDGQLKDFLTPPAPLQKITDRWYARDANWFADFRQTAQKVASLYERSGGPTVDGVIAVTPLVLRDLLQITGPIPMPAYGVVITVENVIPETQRLVTFDYDRARNEPKAFIADLLPEILNRVASLSREQWGPVAEVLVRMLYSKHALVYLREAEAEAAVSSLGWGGTLPDLPPASPERVVDHLGRVEANIGGHKTDDLIDQKVTYDITVSPEGFLNATLVVTRHHRGGLPGASGTIPDEDPALKPNVVYERTLVPLGSELLEAQGFTVPEEVQAPFQSSLDPSMLAADPEVAQLQVHDARRGNITVGREAGFTTFGGWVVTRPDETTVTVLRYRLPTAFQSSAVFSPVARYELVLTKQPGHAPTPTDVTLHIPEGEMAPWAGPEGLVREIEDRRVRFQTDLDRDEKLGVILEKS